MIYGYVNKTVNQLFLNKAYLEIYILFYIPIFTWNHSKCLEMIHLNMLISIFEFPKLFHMKELRLYLSIVIFLFGLQVFSQNEKISIGAKLLPGMSKSNGAIETKFKSSIGGGFQFTTNFNKVIGLESGFYFRNYGFTIGHEFTDNYGHIIGSFKVKYNYNYMSLPVLLRLNIHSFYFALGTNINFFIFGNTNYQGQNVQGIESSMFNIENQKNIVIEPNLNCGYQFAINNKFGINVEARSSITANGIQEGNSVLKIINFGFGIGFCYFIVPEE